MFLVFRLHLAPDFVLPVHCEAIDFFIVVAVPFLGVIVVPLDLTFALIVTFFITFVGLHTLQAS